MLRRRSRVDARALLLGQLARRVTDEPGNWQVTRV